MVHNVIARILAGLGLCLLSIAANAQSFPAGLFPGLTGNVAGIGMSGMDFTSGCQTIAQQCGWMLYSNSSLQLADTTPLLRIQRTDNAGAGGNVGTDALTLWVLTTTSRLNINTHIGILSDMIYQTENQTGQEGGLAIWGQFTKQFKTGFSAELGGGWGGNFDCIDKTAIVNTTTGCRGAEIGMFVASGAGTDTNLQRTGLHIAYGTWDNTTCSTCHIATALLIGGGANVLLDNIVRAQDANANLIWNVIGESANMRMNGQLVIGTQTASANVFGGSGKVNVNNTSDANYSGARFSADATAPSITLVKSRSGTIGTFTQTQSTDGFFYLSGAGVDTTNTIREAVYVQGFGDGSPTSSSVPGLWSFATAASGASPTEAFRLNSSGAAFFPRIGTTASAANAFIDNATTPANSLLRSTSSLRYKTDIIELPDSRLREADKFRPIEYTSLALKDDPNRRFIGYAAEEVAEIDSSLVSYDALGRPDGVQYDRVLLIQVIALQKRVKELEQRLANDNPSRGARSGHHDGDGGRRVRR